MQAQRLWEDTALEEALGQWFAPLLQRVKPGSDQQYGRPIVAVVIATPKFSCAQQ